MQLLLVFVLICSVYSFPSSLRKREASEEYDVVDIEINEPEGRHKRSSPDDGLPERLHAKFTSKGQNRKLRLKRSNSTQVPFFKMENEQIINVPVTKSKRSAVYHDIDTGTVLMVKRSTDNKYYLDGTISLDSMHYNVKQDVNGRHTIRRLRSVTGVNDALAAHEAKNHTKTSRKKRNNPRSKGGHGTIKRTKRAVDSYVVEIALIFDKSVWDSFVREFGSEQDAHDTMYVFGEMIIQGMNERFVSLSKHEDIIITVEANGIYWATSDEVLPFVFDNFLDDDGYYIDEDGALDDFTEWVDDKADWLVPNDHFMWITDRVLGEPNSDDFLTGSAWVDEVCGYYKTSVVREYNAGDTVQTATHELAHNLGVVHDDYYDDCEGQGYLMSSGTDYDMPESQRYNPFRFSDCSAEQIADKVVSNSAWCLSEDNDDTSRPVTLREAGQVFYVDQQCRQALDDNDSYFCPNEVDSDSMCVNLACYDPDDDECYDRYIAYEYTSCDDGKWCIEGECVASDDAPADFYSTYEQER